MGGFVVVVVVLTRAAAPGLVDQGYSYSQAAALSVLVSQFSVPITWNNS
jgi:hypothetical protein